MQEKNQEPGSGPSNENTIRVRFLKGPQEGELLSLAGERLTFGRRPDNDVVINDPNVSGVHAEIVFEGGAPIIRDLGSMNGLFLDNRRIEEVLLSDGDTITLGQCDLEIILKDRSETAAASSVEMDEVRVIRDIRPTKRGIGAVLLFIVILLGLGGSAYYYFFHVREGGTTASAEADENNLAAKGWSFEAEESDAGTGDAWDLEAPAAGRFSRVRGRAHSGAWSLEARMPKGGSALAVRKDRIPVGSRRGYRAAFWASIQGEAAVALKAHFYGSQRMQEAAGLIRVQNIAVSRSEDGVYHKVEGPVIPPSGAASMELRLWAFGRGTVRVDDLELFEVPGSSSTDAVATGKPEIGSSGQGITVMRNRALLMESGRIQVVRDGEEGERVVVDSAASGFRKGEGYQFAGMGAGVLKVSHSFSSAPESVSAGFSVEGASAGGCREIHYCFDLTGRFAEAGVGVFMEDDFAPMTDAFASLTAVALMFGSAHERIMVTLEKPLPVIGERLDNGGLSVHLVFDPLALVESRFTVKSDLTEEIKEAERLIDDARRFERTGRFGGALTAVDRIENAYPFIETVVREAREMRVRIFKEKKRIVAEILDLQQSAVFLQNLDIFKELEKECRTALAAFPGDPELNGLLASVLEQESALRSGRGDDRAESLFLITQNLHEAGGREGTLEVIRSYLTENYPDSEWTRKALELDKDSNAEDRNRN